MNTAYTPGPWHTPREVFNPMKHGHNAETYRAIGIGNGAVHIGYASVSGCIGAQEADANARLIASAPTLLEALQAFIIDAEAFEKGYMATELRPFTRERLLDNARLTIAQATGGNEK